MNVRVPNGQPIYAVPYVVMNGFYFVTGANGVGKTTLVENLKRELIHKPFVVYDFDERGVPDNADGNWRRSETRYWIQKGIDNAVETKSTIVCGFSKPEEVKEAAEELEVPVHVILLDANKDRIVERVMSRYVTPESRAELERTCGKSPEKFAEDSAYISTKLRESAEELGSIIDTSNLGPQEVVSKVIDFIAHTQT